MKKAERKAWIVWGGIRPIPCVVGETTIQGRVHTTVRHSAGPARLQVTEPTEPGDIYPTRRSALRALVREAAAKHRREVRQGAESLRYHLKEVAKAKRALRVATQALAREPRK